MAANGVASASPSDKAGKARRLTVKSTPMGFLLWPSLLAAARRRVNTLRAWSVDRMVAP